MASHIGVFLESFFNSTWKWRESVSHSVVSESVTPGTVAHQAPLSVEFPRQEYWRGLPFPSPGDLPDPGIKPGSPALPMDSLSSEPPGKPCAYLHLIKKKKKSQILKQHFFFLDSFETVLREITVFSQSLFFFFNLRKYCLLSLEDHSRGWKYLRSVRTSATCSLCGTASVIQLSDPQFCYL